MCRRRDVEDLQDRVDQAAGQLQQLAERRQAVGAHRRLDGGRAGDGSECRRHGVGLHGRRGFGAAQGTSAGTSTVRSPAAGVSVATARRATFDRRAVKPAGGRPAASLSRAGPRCRATSSCPSRESGSAPRGSGCARLVGGGGVARGRASMFTVCDGWLRRCGVRGLGRLRYRRQGPDPPRGSLRGPAWPGLVPAGESSGSMMLSDSVAGGRLGGVGVSGAGVHRRARCRVGAGGVGPRDALYRRACEPGAERYRDDAVAKHRTSGRLRARFVSSTADDPSRAGISDGDNIRCPVMAVTFGVRRCGGSARQRGDGRPGTLTA